MPKWLLIFLCLIIMPPLLVEAATLKDVQEMLIELGYNPGTPDGLRGRKTRNALRKFQRDHALRRTGRMNLRTVKALQASIAAKKAAQAAKAAAVNEPEAPATIDSTNSTNITDSTDTIDSKKVTDETKATESEHAESKAAESIENADIVKATDSTANTNLDDNNPKATNASEHSPLPTNTKEPDIEHPSIDSAITTETISLPNTQSIAIEPQASTPKEPQKSKDSQQSVIATITRSQNQSRSQETSSKPKILRSVQPWPKEKTVPIPSPVGIITFSRIPGGCFITRTNGTKSTQEVCVHKNTHFLISQHEITQGQWQKVMKDNPAGATKGKDHPIENVSWNDIQNFIAKLNSTAQGRYRLPTEAEWEYAAHGGYNNIYWWGNVDPTCEIEKTNGANFSGGISCPHTTTKVGTYAPNPYGLYDMHGNVWEWVQDVYSASGYDSKHPNDPVVTKGSHFRVFRGGSWLYPGDAMAVYNRDRAKPDFHFSHLGFRLVYEEP